MLKVFLERVAASEKVKTGEYILALPQALYDIYASSEGFAESIEAFEKHVKQVSGNKVTFVIAAHGDRTSIDQLKSDHPGAAVMVAEQLPQHLEDSDLESIRTRLGESGVISIKFNTAEVPKLTSLLLGGLAVMTTNPQSLSEAEALAQEPLLQAFLRNVSLQDRSSYLLATNSPGRFKEGFNKALTLVARYPFRFLGVAQTVMRSFRSFVAAVVSA